MAAFLVGAKAIAEELIRLGLISESDPNAEDKVYYFARAKKVSIGRFGNSLIASPDRLRRDVEKLVS
jgi:hypothetical protein